MIIAQRFNVGDRPYETQVSPEGTSDAFHPLILPFGPRDASPHLPNGETLGFYPTSLRDENEFLTKRATRVGEFIREKAGGTPALQDHASLQTDRMPPWLALLTCF